MIRFEPSGFSYIEVLVVLGLFAILALTALPQLAIAVPDGLQAALVARQIAADLRRAQELAISMRAWYSLEFSPVTAPFTSYTVNKKSCRPWEGACTTPVTESDYPVNIPSGVTVSGRQTFCFEPGGDIRDVCLTGPTGTDGSVTISAGSATATVWVYWYVARIKVVGP